jgi:hypothetical protein
MVKDSGGWANQEWARRGDEGQELPHLSGGSVRMTTQIWAWTVENGL